MHFFITLLLIACTTSSPELFAPGSPANSEELSGSWKVIQINGLEKMELNPTMEFVKDEKQVRGFAGCNTYFAGYTIKGNELTIGNAGSTRKMCADMSVEDAFLKQLENIAHYKKVKSELHLFDAKDKLIMLAIAE